MSHPVQAAAESLVLHASMRTCRADGPSLQVVSEALRRPWPVVILAHWHPDPTRPPTLASTRGLTVAALTALRRDDHPSAALALALRALAASGRTAEWRSQLVTRCAVMSQPGLIRHGFEVRTPYGERIEHLAPAVRRVVGTYASAVLHGTAQVEAIHQARRVAEAVTAELALAAEGDCGGWGGPTGAPRAQRELLKLLAAAIDDHERATIDPASSAVWRLGLPLPAVDDDVEVALSPLTAEVLCAFPSGVRGSMLLSSLPRVCAQAIALVEPVVRMAPSRT